MITRKLKSSSDLSRAWRIAPQFVMLPADTPADIADQPGDDLHFSSIPRNRMDSLVNFS